MVFVQFVAGTEPNFLDLGRATFFQSGEGISVLAIAREVAAHLREVGVSFIELQQEELPNVLTLAGLDYFRRLALHNPRALHLEVRTLPPAKHIVFSWSCEERHRETAEAIFSERGVTVLSCTEGEMTEFDGPEKKTIPIIIYQLQCAGGARFRKLGETLLKAGIVGEGPFFLPQDIDDPDGELRK